MGLGEFAVQGFGDKSFVLVPRCRDRNQRAFRVGHAECYLANLTTASATRSRSEFDIHHPTGMQR